jgi:hypothetical protein
MSTLRSSGITRGKIIEIDLFADTERLRRLDLAVVLDN